MDVPARQLERPGTLGSPEWLGWSVAVRGAFGVGCSLGSGGVAIDEP